MELKELRDLYRKKIPAAYKELEMAALLPESEAKRLKIQRANTCIENAMKILIECSGKLNFKDELILWQRAENLPLKNIALFLYGVADKHRINNVASLETLAFKRFHKILVAKNEEMALQKHEIRASIEERKRTRDLKMKG